MSVCTARWGVCVTGGNRAKKMKYWSGQQNVSAIIGLEFNAFEGICHGCRDKNDFHYYFNLQENWIFEPSLHFESYNDAGNNILKKSFLGNIRTVTWLNMNIYNDLYTYIYIYIKYSHAVGGISKILYSNPLIPDWIFYYYSRRNSIVWCAYLTTLGSNKGYPFIIYW